MGPSVAAYAAEEPVLSEEPVTAAGYIPLDEELDIAALDSSYTPEMVEEMLSGESVKVEPVEGAFSIFGAETASVFDEMPLLPAASPMTKYPEDPMDYIENVLPPARNQNPAGDCWAFTSIALMELYRDSHDDELSINRERDLSESHLVHYTFSTGNNVILQSLGREYDDILTYNGTEYDKFTIGGSMVHAAENLLRWRGAVNEEDSLSHTFDKNTYKDIINSYTWDPEKEYQVNKTRLKEYYEINIKKNPELVKSWIYEHGAVGVSYYSDKANDNYKKNDSDEIIDAYYCPPESKNAANHAVTVVGWDDGYSRENFREDRQPESDGAWLVRNSWAYDNTKKGSYYRYFWLSYEDATLSEAAFAFVPEDVSEGALENRYYYDSQQSTPLGSSYNSRSIRAYSANVFTANGADREILRSVDFHLSVPADTSDPYTATVYVFINPDEGDPMSGTEVYRQTRQLPYTGQYSFEIDGGAELKRWDTFSVVVEMDGSLVSKEYTTTSGYAGRYTTVFSNPGESYSKAGTGAWKDIGGGEKKGNFIISARTESLENHGTVKKGAQEETAGDDSGVKEAGGSSDKGAVGKNEDGGVSVEKSEDSDKKDNDRTDTSEKQEDAEPETIVPEEAPKPQKDETETVKTIGADKTVEVDGVEMPAAVEVKYTNTIEYTGSAIKPSALGATVDRSNLVAVADKLKTRDVAVDERLFKVSYTVKKNKNAGTEAYFYAKLSLDQSRLKKLKLSRADLKTLKAAVSEVNKSLKAEENRRYFTITPVNIEGDGAARINARFKKSALKLSWMKFFYNGKFRKVSKNKQYRIISRDPEGKSVTIEGIGNFTGERTFLLN